MFRKAISGRNANSSVLLWRAGLSWRVGLLWRAGLPRVGWRSRPNKSAAVCQSAPGLSFWAASQPNAGQALMPFS
ncbi:hypothetical protein C1Y19_27870 [Pseudomonas sp. MPR-LB3]|nr:hypothetical protein C1Y24_20955 [Pseudomonas sp. MPR-R2A4]PMX52086.1 hypothetical protein C1Y17_20490 [Pseudomonas sp. MPR-R2A6]PMX88983.1 hypothetical protein C1Y21_20280 [Pseudomonas sp. MPR-R2A3]PNA26622.1 hypothetical protein C1Y16_27005 [Pseudomonas sp. MPR-ANB1]PNA43308.1 hypothetical protein C1Y15_21045 [Pseudomonas sp. MPR-LB5]PNA67852.1 hypothetical protein C1Y19_27870 [Pseudomonas sp. MPR-LB3]